eukprot:TRINITY_DN4275_c0_g3_i5.p1 TRINITY_DN4275_c0_g3~~TRINITY_DN4275_c0_g3_i5.p1  ORF type:complete len:300 (+),score=-39.95 TRINITY_DN4275_c0_g3_i5:37-900(+)
MLIITNYTICNIAPTKTITNHKQYLLNTIQISIQFLKCQPKIPPYQRLDILTTHQIFDNISTIFILQINYFTLQIIHKRGTHDQSLMLVLLLFSTIQLYKPLYHVLYILETFNQIRQLQKNQPRNQHKHYVSLYRRFNKKYLIQLQFTIIRLFIYKKIFLQFLNKQVVLDTNNQRYLNKKCNLPIILQQGIKMLQMIFSDFQFKTKYHKRYLIILEFIVFLFMKQQKYTFQDNVFNLNISKIMFLKIRKCIQFEHIEDIKDYVSLNINIRQYVHMIRSRSYTQQFSK